MRILTFDTSGETCSAALTLGRETREAFLHCPREQTRQIIPMIKTLCAESACEFASLDAIGVTAGPGSFTGLRIGAGVAMGLALAHDLPLCGVSTLAVLALGAYYDFAAQEVMALLDARMNEVYWGHYRLDQASATMVGTDNLSAPTNVEWPLQGALVGNGLTVCEPRLPEGHDQVIMMAGQTVHAKHVVPYVLAAQESGALLDVNAFELNYLRNKVTS